MHILDLPSVMLIEIFEYLSYDEVSRKRLVCRRFDQIAQQVLNGGFNKVIKQHSISSKRIKALLPRRESERRNHCLARHSDILTSIETRISMLSMTYTKYMDLNLCCFIPGRVLDEILRILRLISKTNKQLRPHEVLQELRDISSMAIEHFDERIANNLKKCFVDSSKMCGSSEYSAETRRLAATSGLRNISFSGMGTSTPTTFTSAAVSLYGNNTYIIEPIKQRLGVIGERMTVNSYKPINESEAIQYTLPSTSTGVLENPSPLGRCPEARTTMVYLKKLETEYKKGIVKDKVDMVAHFAALKAVGESCRIPLQYYHNNMTGTNVLLEAMADNNVFKFVYSSSATVYGEPQFLPVTEEHPTANCTRPYGKGKYFTEEILKDLCKSDKRWAVVSLRYFNPVGAHPSGRIGEDPNGEPNNLMPYIAQAAVGRRDCLQVYGTDFSTTDGTGVRDYIHIVDLAEGHVKALGKLRNIAETGFFAYNLGTGVGYSVFEMLHAFEKASDRKMKHKLVERRLDDVATCFADASLAEKALGWKATRGVDEMCTDTWRWQSNNPNGYAAK